jgi:hypothetical protein
VGTFDFLRERPLQPGDDEQVRRALQPLTGDNRYVLHRWLNEDGSLRGVRLIDTRDRRSGDQASRWAHTEAVVRLLREAGFEAREIPASQSAWGDIEIDQRL